jgi:nitrogen fixation/metabolism regulation signal transduction histidine kinase
MTLRARLIIALLALALVPTAIYTVFTLDQLNRAIGRWYQPGVERSLGSALEVTKHSLLRLDAAVTAQAQRWSGAWPREPIDPDRLVALRADLRAAGMDFVQIYRRRDGRFVLERQETPPGVIAATPTNLADEIPTALASGQIIHSPRGAIAAAAPLGADGALVVGLWVPPDYFAEVESVGRGMTYYRQLGVYVELKRRFIWVVVAAVVFGLVALALLLATSLAREMSRPIGELSAAIERVAGGELTTRVTPKGALELRSLGDSFNQMTERLLSAREALQQAEREAAWRDVARKLAHEFKNILTPMKLSLQLLECEIDSLPEARRTAAGDSLHAALREVGHLERLAEQFFQYARLPEPQFERVDLAELVETASRLSPTPVHVSSPSSGLALVRGDRLLLSRAVHNLLLNACEASPPGAEVETRTIVRGDRAEIEVLDRGAGIPDPVRHRLFDPYVSTKKRGSGLGLSLVRDIARQHGGMVTLEDREGGGARACLSLPLLREPALAEARS